jgi:hypothetical protein
VHRGEVTITSAVVMRGTNSLMIGDVIRAMTVNAGSIMGTMRRSGAAWTNAAVQPGERTLRARTAVMDRVTGLSHVDQAQAVRVVVSGAAAMGAASRADPKSQPKKIAAPLCG